MKKGFSLIEVLLVTAILAVLGTVGSGFFGFYAKNIELDATAKAITADLKFARSKALAGENGLHWGVHFENGASSDFYVIYSSPTSTYANASTTAMSTTTLGSGIVFVAPPTSSSTNILFTTVTGATSSSTITISRDGDTRAIHTSPAGTVF